MSDHPHPPSFDENILKKVEALQEKYAAMGQDLNAYLDGLLHADYLTYWDYINLDTLLSLQHPITPFPDESIFIIYHQITELYFKLALHELRPVEHFSIERPRSNFEASEPRKPLLRSADSQFRNHGGRHGPGPILEIPHVAVTCQRFSECAVPNDRNPEHVI